MSKRIVHCEAEIAILADFKGKRVDLMTDNSGSIEERREESAFAWPVLVPLFLARRFCQSSLAGLPLKAARFPALASLRAGLFSVAPEALELDQ